MTQLFSKNRDNVEKESPRFEPGFERKLSRAGWLRQQAPLFWVELDYDVLKFSYVRRNLLDKWIEKNTSGWWYADDKVYIFSNKKDRTTLLTFWKSGFFHTLDGEF